MKRATIELSPYNSEWPLKFETEKDFLVNIVGSYNHGSVEHVGSTSVPGLIAKPVIDIMFGVISLEESKSCIELLTKNGYCYFPYKEDVMHWFCKPSDRHRTHHLHLIPYQNSLWNARIKFRDTLRNNPKVAAEYAKLKTDLAAQQRNDREMYTSGKWPFIKKILDDH